MKRILFIALALSVLTGCDGFRWLAGRPTSADLAAKQAILAAKQAFMEQREENHRQVMADSIRHAGQTRQTADDSLAALDSLQRINGKMLAPTAMGGLGTTRLENRYYIVIGTFAMPGNAEALLERVQKDGYDGTVIRFRNGYNAVGICPTDHLPTAFAALKKVKTETFCPSDVWILVNEP